MTPGPRDDPLDLTLDTAADWHHLVQRARALSRPGGLAVLGIAGKPGAGKSTLAAALAAAVGSAAVLLPMDGFHLSNAVLADLGLAHRKGAPDTFDAWGYVALLERLRGALPADRQGRPVIYAPTFDRTRDEPTAAAIAIPPGTPLVITEGNYLLLDKPPWNLIHPLLDEAWFVNLPDPVRQTRLIARHTAFGKSPGDAHRWATGNDEANAILVAATAATADLRVRLETWAPDIAPPPETHDH